MAQRLLCIGCSNYAPLRELLADGPAPLDWVAAPFGQVYPTLLTGDAACWNPPPDVTLVWTQPQRISSAFAARFDGGVSGSDQILADVDEFAAAVCAAAAGARTLTLVMSWALPPDERGAGCADWLSVDGLAPTVARMNLRLAERLSGAPGVLLLDAQRCLAAAGRYARDPKLWLLGKIPYARPVFEAVAEEVRAALSAATGGARKLLVLDLDHTLWGGVVGDDGWENLQVGGPAPVGEAYAEFQREVRRLQRRGVVLAVCSKNDERVALEALDRHPEMLVRRDDLAAWRINWEDKAENLRALTGELHLGLSSAVFIDDSAAERARVREALPEVLVPEWPADPARYAGALRELRCFDALRVTDEDRARSASYVAERRRREVRDVAQSLDEWLARLDLRVETRELSEADLPRAAQLLNKTNQFNLLTRRLSEPELRELAGAADTHVFTFRVADRFGDYGLTGLATLRTDARAAWIDDFVLSCRVLGRGVERVMLDHLRAAAAAAGCRRLIGRRVPTARNGPCATFLPASGFRAAGQDAWELDLGAAPPARPGRLEEVLQAT